MRPVTRCRTRSRAHRPLSPPHALLRPKPRLRPSRNRVGGLTRVHLYALLMEARWNNLLPRAQEAKQSPPSTTLSFWSNSCITGWGWTRNGTSRHSVGSLRTYLFRLGAAHTSPATAPLSGREWWHGVGGRPGTSPSWGARGQNWAGAPPPAFSLPWLQSRRPFPSSPAAWRNSAAAGTAATALRAAPQLLTAPQGRSGTLMWTPFWTT